MHIKVKILENPFNSPNVMRQIEAVTDRKVGRLSGTRCNQTAVIMN